MGGWCLVARGVVLSDQMAVPHNAQIVTFTSQAQALPRIELEVRRPPVEAGNHGDLSDSEQITIPATVRYAARLTQR